MLPTPTRAYHNDERTFVIMASDFTNTTPLPQMRPEEMRRLAQRLRARADSILMKDQPHQAVDLRTAAGLIEQFADLTTEILSSAAMIDRLAGLLRVAGGA